MKKSLITINLLLLVLILSSISTFAQPCACCTPEHRQFDFWLGDWDVYVNDTIRGTNSIVMSQDSCLLVENWNSNQSAYSGTSYNFYNPINKTWNQTWVDNQGGNLVLQGEFSEGKMVLVSEPTPNPKGKTILNRITWTPDYQKNVRQVWEVSEDFGESWTPAFDGLYVKRK